MNKKNKIIIAVVAAVVAVAIGVTTFILATRDSGGADNRIDYKPHEYKDYICANCDLKIEGNSYMPSDLFMQFVILDYEKEELAICEECAKKMYEDELASGKSLDEFLRK